MNTAHCLIASWDEVAIVSSPMDILIQPLLLSNLLNTQVVMFYGSDKIVTQ
jgi:hypothetical protein